MERLDRFMARASATYYAGLDPYADFTTAPELSQVFGEVLGAWAAVVWRGLGAPDPVLLTEAGPGRGTLMADALRAIGQIAPDFQAASRLHLIERSARLREMQRGRLGGASWHDDLAGVPPGPMLLLANEFLDALPVRQFVRRQAGWMERHVCAGVFVECPAEVALGAADDGVVVELGEARRDWVAALAGRIAGGGGAALLIDYGPAASGPGDSLQALRGGRPADPLADPGSADLTAHVDFAALAAAARGAGAAVFGPLPQGLFLARLGLFERTGQLGRGQPPARALALMAAARRLAEPDRMGRLFKVLALCQVGAPPPPGFEPA